MINLNEQSGIKTPVITMEISPLITHRAKGKGGVSRGSKLISVYVAGAGNMR